MKESLLVSVVVFVDVVVSVVASVVSFASLRSVGQKCQWISFSKYRSWFRPLLCLDWSPEPEDSGLAGAPVSAVVLEDCALRRKWGGT